MPKTVLCIWGILSNKIQNSIQNYEMKTKAISLFGLFVCLFAANSPCKNLPQANDQN